MTPATTITRVNAPPVLVARVDERTVAMDVRSVSIDVCIAGLASETTMEITFTNPHDRDLEGEVLFPLPEGAGLCGYGLDIGGQVVPASLVAKRRAREIFDAEVRKNVDPGLVEYVAGNLFRTRVWPIPGRGGRTVRVTWVAPLSVSDDAAVYELPIRFSTPKRDVSEDQAAGLPAWATFFDPGPGAEAAEEAFRLRVAVAKSVVTPAIDGDLGFEDRGSGWVAEATRPESVPDLVRVALPSLPARCSVVERDPDGECWFRIEDLVEPGATDGSPASPARVRVVWDASLSRGETDLGRDFEALRALLSEWGTLDVRLVVLRDVVRETGDFRVLAGDCEELLETLRDLPYDGGTAPLPEFSGDCDLTLFFSDGLATFGAAEPASAPKPLHTLSSAPVANHALLRHLAESSGGVHLDLLRQSTEEVVAAVTSDRLCFLGVETEAGETMDILPFRAVPVAAGRFAVSGLLVSEEAEIALLYGRAGEVSERRTYVLRRPPSGDSMLVARLWAQRKADELSVLPERNAEELLTLGRRFGLVTPNSSLLVLETLEQHLEHDVEPDPSRTELHGEWTRHRREVEIEEEERLARKLARVREWWGERVEWWEKEHEPKPKPKKVEDAPQRFMARMRPAEPMAGADMDLAMMDDAVLSETGAVKAEVGSPVPPGGAIAVRGWDPDTPYLRAIKDAGEAGAYGRYLDLRGEYARSPSFYLDCANHLYRIGERDRARRVLSNVVELDLENPALLRICAYKLGTEGEPEAAAEILERVLAMRPDEPQSHRDLALVLAETGEYRRAAELLWKVVVGGWDGRFPRIETIALVELGRLVERARRDGAYVDADAIGIDGELLKLLDVDLRVVLAWDADLTDVDLWVIEPTGEKCFYSNKLTGIGGRISEDFTGGYGPEEYMVRRAAPGTYEIKANFYSSSQQNLVGPATILATIFTNYGRPDEERRVVTVRVEEVKEVLDIAEATY